MVRKSLLRCGTVIPLRATSITGSIAFSIVLIASLWLPAAGGTDSGLVVGEAAWTSRVAEREVTNRFDTGTAPLKPIVFWVRLVGTREALDELGRTGKLPIFHEWLHYTGPTPHL